jgi:hypothetical protein
MRQEGKGMDGRAAVSQDRSGRMGSHRKATVCSGLAGAERKGSQGNVGHRKGQDTDPGWKRPGFSVWLGMVDGQSKTARLL